MKHVGERLPSNGRFVSRTRRHVRAAATSVYVRYSLYSRLDFQHCPFRYRTGLQVAPQLHQQPARQRHDSNPTHPATPTSKPLLDDESASLADLTQRRDELQQALQSAGQALYKQAKEEPGPESGEGSPEAGGDKDEEVVDAEYTEE